MKPTPEQYAALGLPRDIHTAKRKGHDYYYTGKPCVHGHITLRRNNSECLECYLNRQRRDIDIDEHLNAIVQTLTPPPNDIEIQLQYIRASIDAMWETQTADEQRALLAMMKDDIAAMVEMFDPRNYEKRMAGKTKRRRIKVRAAIPQLHC